MHTRRRMALRASGKMRRETLRSGEDNEARRQGIAGNLHRSVDGAPRSMCPILAAGHRPVLAHFGAKAPRSLRLWLFPPSHGQNRAHCGASSPVRAVLAFDRRLRLLQSSACCCTATRLAHTHRYVGVASSGDAAAAEDAVEAVEKLSQAMPLLSASKEGGEIRQKRYREPTDWAGDSLNLVETPRSGQRPSSSSSPSSAALTSSWGGGVAICRV